ncbi:MAG: hypothetical protein DYG92_08810 [Leptolyngbya sp. PLA1]|nr:hypothetical protein [Leptolyngbya sp. PLA1]
MPPLFHVTDPANVESILRDGLRADEDGCIFALTDERLANSIARDQVFLTTYALFRIDRKGITGRVEADEVAELAARWHRVILQPVIAPQFLRLVNPSIATQRGPTDGDYMRNALAGMSRDQVDALFARIRELREEPTVPPRS